VLGPRGIAPIGRDQLAAWQQIAVRWPLTLSGRARVCQACGKGVMLAADEHGAPYRYTPAEVTAHVVLHLRNHHADLDPDQGPGQ
jgi:hypothetical protein